MSADLARLVQQVTRKVLSNPETRDKLYKTVKDGAAGAERFFKKGFGGGAGAQTASKASGYTASSAGSASQGAGAGAAGGDMFGSLSRRVKDWQRRAADPLLREELMRKLVGFVTMNFMGLIMLFQVVDGLYKSWKRSTEEGAKRQKIAEQKEAEQNRMRAMAQASQGQQNNRPPLREAVGNAAANVAWATQRGAGWAMAEGGVLLNYQRQTDPLERTELSKWAIGGTADESFLGAPAAVDPLYGVVATPALAM